MAAAGTCSSATSNSMPSLNALKRDSDDVGWEYGQLTDHILKDKIMCKLCSKVISGGINRMKQHIAGMKGNVAACKVATDQDKAKCRKALEDVKEKKKQKCDHEKEVRKEVNIFGEDEVTQEEVYMQGANANPRKLGPMDRFTSPIDPEEAPDGSRRMRQQNINDALFKQRTLDAQQVIARWVYESGIPFHAISGDNFTRVLEAAGQFGPGLRAPSQYQLIEPLLKNEVLRTKELLKKQEEEWRLNGCSIMTDAWSDRKRRSIMNLCVNCKEGTTFLSSKEASLDSHTGAYIFEYVDKCIDDIGEKNVVQVVLDDASNNMAAANLLKEKRPNIFWTSCATHTLNLMLQGIGNLPKFKGVIEKAKSFTIYIYAHHKTLALLSKFTKKKDIVRPGVTRFATAFLTLQRLMEKKKELLDMVTSEEWKETNHSKSVKGKAAMAIAHSVAFWRGVSLCLKEFAPLVKVLRLVDGDKKPAMGFVYGELLRAKEDIKKVYNDQETLYLPILDIVDGKARDRLDSPLHLASYLLNPYYSFENPNVVNDENVMDGFITCVEAIFPEDITTQSTVTNVELHKFINKEGMFGRVLAKEGCKQNNEAYDPVAWWNVYGNGVPNLKKMAKRILSLTTSSSGCERNWSSFEGIHTKKRNRLDTTRLNNLVYVQFNYKIFTKKRRDNVDVLLANEATCAQGWIVDGGYDDVDLDLDGGDDDGLREDCGLERRRSARVQDIRELHEDDFISDEEEMNEMNFDFESDTDEVLEQYGEEEFEM